MIQAGRAGGKPGAESPHKLNSTEIIAGAAKAIDFGSLHICIFERARHGNVIGCNRDQPVDGEISAAGVADQDERAASRKRFEPICDTGCRISFIGYVAGEHDVEIASRPDHVARAGFDCDAVFGAVDCDGREREGIDVIGDDASGSRFGRGDRDEAGARRKIEDALARNERRTVENIARQRLSTGPGKGPIRRRQIQSAELHFGSCPERRRFIGEMEADLRRQRHRGEAGLSQDEAAMIERHACIYERQT